MRHVRNAPLLPESSGTEAPGATADGQGTPVHCCGHEGQVIELRGGEEPLRMVRCGTCGHREWRLGAETVAVDAAFEVLAVTYRALPRAARAARDRAASQTAARAASRAARAARTVPAQPDAAAVDRSDLKALLQGWQVLGATG